MFGIWSYLLPEINLSFRCEDEGVQQPVLLVYGFPFIPSRPYWPLPHKRVPPRICNEDGTWSGENLICGKNAAERLPLITVRGSSMKTKRFIFSLMEIPLIFIPNGRQIVQDEIVWFPA